ncbi:MAG: methyltransferase domain-containing protein [Chloroflexia bacterium]|nr:methyltransferase domain-containing protein [Chloroflexia bacterium]
MPVPAMMSPEALAEHIGQAVLGGLEALCIALGDQLGLYAALQQIGPATPAHLAAYAGADPRYIREWLEQQAMATILTCENPEATPEERRFALPEGYGAVLTEPESLSGMAPLAQAFAGVVAPFPQLLAAFRTGAGVPYADYGEHMHIGQARANRASFTHLLAQEWIAAMPDIAARLQGDPPARVADIGVGQGWSSIALARAFPRAHIDGLDLDPASINAAQENAAAAGLTGERVAFHLRDAGDPALAGQYDLALAIECIHDMPRPVEVLQAMRRLVGPGGTVLIVDERVQDTYTPNGDPGERMMYAFSVLHCLPVGLVEQPSAGTGTVMRRDIFRGYAEAAGYTAITELPVEHDTFRFYRLTA